jgi:thiol-disulfide isomerase/thioredoxin
VPVGLSGYHANTAVEVCINPVGFTIRLFLAGLLFVAGVSKLADRVSTKRTLREFGLPARAVPALALVLPLTEIAVALALLPAASVRFAALGALGLVVSFSVVVGIELVRGRRPECHCFGQLSGETIGWRTLARNGLLTAAAAFVVVSTWDGSAPGDITSLVSISANGREIHVGGTLVIVILGETLLLWRLQHQKRRLQLRVDALESRALAEAPTAFLVSEEPIAGLAVGSRAPAFSLDDIDGETQSLDSLLALDKTVMLVFVEPECRACRELMPEIARWQQQHRTKITIAVVSRGTNQANRARGFLHAVDRVLLQRELEVLRAFGAQATPSAVLVGIDGTIGSPVAQGSAAIRALVAHAAEAPLLRRMVPYLAAERRRPPA